MVASTTTLPQLTAEQVQKILIQPLQDASVFLSAGPRIFDTASQIRIPRAPKPNDAQLAWVGENEVIPEADYTADDELVLMPSTMKSIKVITRYSVELARQSIANISQVLQDRLVTDVATRLDKQLLSNTGDGITTPKGVFTYAGHTVALADKPLGLDDLLDAWGIILAADVSAAGLRLLIDPDTFVALRKLKAADGRYLLEPDATVGAGYTVLGTPVVVTKRLPAGSALLADFSQIAVARDIAPSVTTLSELYAGSDQIGLKVTARYDAAPINAEGILAFTGIKAA